MYHLAAPCGGLNEDGPHRLRRLNALASPVSGTVWEGVGCGLIDGYVTRGGL